MIVKCAVVDDNKQDLQKIHRVFTELSLETTLKFENQYFIEPKLQNIEIYDLFILDIDMPGTNGFQFANQVFEKIPKACIIFCTNHEDLVFDAFRLNPFYFVRKSFLQDDLKSALRKYIKSFSKTKNTYVINNRGLISPIPLSDINYFEVSKNDLYIHTAEKKEYKERKSVNYPPAKASGLVTPQ